MKWSWRLGSIAGIALYVHATFVLLLAWVALREYQTSGDAIQAIGGVVFVVAIFATVVLHELGHALAARRYGIRTRDITLLPIGGVARLEAMPKEPRQELVVALAGPMVNVVIAGLLWLWLAATGGMPDFAGTAFIGEGFLDREFIARLLAVNIWLVLFNLIPAFPMDGGRVLRALLAFRLDYTTATQTAAAVGQGIAMLFGLLGLALSNPLLIFIAVFVWFAAAQEAGAVAVRSALEGVPVMRVMITDFRCLRPDDPLSRAVGYMLDGFQQDFPVVEGDRPVGILTHTDLATALREFGEETPVARVMQSDFAAAHPKEAVQAAFERLPLAHGRTLLVVADGHLVGLLSADNVAEMLMSRQRPRMVDSIAPFDRPGRSDRALVRAAECAEGIARP